MAAKRKSIAKAEDKGLAGMWPPVWMTTYSDLVTNVMTFFVVIAAMLVLKIDISALQLGEKNIANQPDPSRTIAQINKSQKILIDKVRQLEEQQLREIASVTEVQKMGEEIAQYIQEAKLKGFVRVETTKWKIKVIPLVPFLFPPARAVIRPQAKDFLDRLAKFISLNPGQIRIAGHTDNLPLYTAEFRSNWELSCARATAIMRYFVEDHGLDPQKFTAVGCGPYHPVADNATPEGRKQNRRVEIEIVQKAGPELSGESLVPGLVKGIGENGAAGVVEEAEEEPPPPGFNPGM